MHFCRQFFESPDLIVFERPARIVYEAHSLAAMSEAERETVRGRIRQVLAADAVTVADTQKGRRRRKAA